MRTVDFLNGIQDGSVVVVGTQIWPLIITVNGCIYEIRDAQLPADLLGTTVTAREFSQLLVLGASRRLGRRLSENSNIALQQ